MNDLFWVAGTLAVVGSVVGQEAEESVAVKLGDSSEARAVWLGVPGEFVPPTPTPKRAPADLKVLQEREDHSGGRVLRVRRVANPGLPEAPPPPASSPATRMLNEEQLQALRDAMPEHRTLMVGATIYEDPAGGALTHFRWWHEGESFEGWSSVDFSYFASLLQIESHGIHYSVLLFPGRTKTGVVNTFTGEQIEAPEHPELPEGEVAFVVTAGDEDNEKAIEGIMALHEVYVAEKDRLHDAYVKRERYREEFLAWRKANPPQPKDVNVSFWVRKGGSSKEDTSK